MNLGEVTIEKIKRETRRPMLVKMAAAFNIAVEPTDSVPLLKEKLTMAIAPPRAPSAPKAPAAPAAPKAPPAAPKAAAPSAPKAPAAAPKAAAPAAPPKAGPPKAPAAAPKAAAAPAAAPAAGGVPPAVAAAIKKAIDDVVAQFTAFSGELEQTLLRIDARLNRAELTGAGYPAAGVDFLVITDEGAVMINFEGITDDATAALCEAFGQADLAALKKVQKAKDFQGWLPPSMLAAPAAEEAPAEEAAAEGEGVLTDADIDKANWTQLVEWAGALGVDISAIKGEQPKVLRPRLKKALAEAMAAQAAEGGEAPAEEGGELTEGTEINVTIEGALYPATFVRASETDGNVIVKWDANGEEADVPFDTLSAR